MKNNDSKRKLTLSRQTLRRLESPQLAEVAGGSVLTQIPAQCTTGFSASTSPTC